MQNNQDINGSIAKLVLENGAEENCKEYALHFAVRTGDFEIVKMLLDKDDKIGHGKTPPLEAIGENKVKVAELLNAQDKAEKTPIYYAIENGDLKITKLLLTKGANVKDNPELLNIAVKKRCIDIVEVLLQHDVDINATDNDGRTALHFTALSEEEDNLKGFLPFIDNNDNENGADIAKLLLRKGAKVDAQTKNGVTTLYAAIQEGYTKVIKVLLEYNANVKSDITPLHLSARRRNKEIAELLLSKGADVNGKLENGITALHIAIIKCNKDVVNVLLEYGAKVDSKITNNFITPLHLASQGGHLEIVEALLEYGSDVNITSKSNHTSLDYAMAALAKSYFQISSYCDDEFDPSDVGNTCEDIAMTLRRHILKMKTANLYVGEKNLLSMRNSAKKLRRSDLSDFQNKCAVEIACMKNEKICHDSISFYDILAKSTKSLAIYMRNKDIVQVLKADNYKTKFPIYASMIRSYFRKNMQRKELLEKANTISHFLFNNLPELPYDCMDKIFGYLSDEDLGILMDANPNAVEVRANPYYEVEISHFQPDYLMCYYLKRP